VGGVFINYRGEDSQTAAALIDRELTARFGRDLVFLDCRSIPAGADFADELLGQPRVCSVLLVVIGPRWLTLTNESGQHRIDDPRDWIRREIVEALTYGLRVIPVLLDGVELPAETDLPADIAGLARRQYVPLRRRYTEVDLAYLVERIVEVDLGLAKVDERRQVSAGPVPRQLPAAPAGFAGRREELARLTAALDDSTGQGATVVISAIAGAGGIGKTWLALHWAHQHVDRFPDGQLVVNLNGFAPTDAPMTPARAVRGFLDALGVEPGSIPVELQAQIGLYRSLVAGRRMLILLDNARTAEQVVPLLPGSPTCTVLITSRNRLSSVLTAHGAHPLPVDVLTDHEARQLLAGRLGAHRLAAEPAAVTELLGCCGGLPLALSIVAGRAQTHPNFPLAHLAAELRDATTRLGALDDEDPAASLPAVLSWSYTTLPTNQARMFELLGIAPGPDISLPAAAHLTNQPIPQTRALLRGLEHAHLVHQHLPGRYRMHDLIALYANDRAHHDLPDTDRTDGLRRLADFYLHTANTADRLLQPHRPPIQLDPPGSDYHPVPLADSAAAWVWLDAEHRCLLATQQLAADHGWHRTVWQLAWTLTTFDHRRGHRHDLLAAWQAGLAAAHHDSDPASLCLAHRNLGHTYAHLGRHTDALAHLGYAQTLAEDTRDLAAQAHTHRALGRAWELQGDDQRALEHATNALHRFQALDQPVLEADARSMVGWYSARLGLHQQAHTHLHSALTLARHHGGRHCEATTLDTLGYLAHHTGQHDQALHHYQQALTLRRKLGLTYGEADTLDRLGHTHVALGDPDRARHTWQQALQLYQTQHRVHDAQRIQHQLDTLTTPNTH
jgi:tetratricopeptide (TPR) repeat protein